MAVTFLTVKVARKYSKLKVPFRQILMLDSALKVTRELGKTASNAVLSAGRFLELLGRKLLPEGQATSSLQLKSKIGKEFSHCSRNS